MEEDTMRHSQKMTVKVTVNVLTTMRWLRGAGGWHLRLKSLEIFHQISIYGWLLGGAVEFEFKTPYKLQVVV